MILRIVFARQNSVQLTLSRLSRFAERVSLKWQTTTGGNGETRERHLWGCVYNASFLFLPVSLFCVVMIIQSLILFVLLLISLLQLARKRSTESLQNDDVDLLC